MPSTKAIFRAVALICVVWLTTTARADSIIVGHRISGSAREREIIANEKRYQDLVAFRSLDPARFDRLHPFYGLLLSNASFFDQYLDRWQANPARFEFYHPCAWRVLDGGVHLSTPPVIDTPTPPIVDEGSPPLPPVPQSSTPPTTPLPPTEPGPIPHAAVPEPSAVVLLLSGMGLSLLVRAGLRARERSA